MQDTAELLRPRGAELCVWEKRGPGIGGVWVSGASETMAHGDAFRQASEARDLGLYGAEEGKPLSLQQLPEVEDGVAQEIASAE
jgi:hypothetical protein